MKPGSQINNRVFSLQNPIFALTRLKLKGVPQVMLAGILLGRPLWSNLKLH